MDEKKANLCRKTGMIMRLSGIAALAVWWAMGYVEYDENIYRLYDGGTRTVMVVTGMLLDTIFTLLWERSKTIYSIHKGLHIGLGWIYYIIVILDKWNTFGGGIGLIIFLFIGPAMALIGLIPFGIFNAGDKPENSKPR